MKSIRFFFIPLNFSFYFLPSLELWRHKQSQYLSLSWMMFSCGIEIKKG